MQKHEGPVFEQTTGEQAFNKLVFEDVLLDSPCVYVIKKQLFNNLKFKEGTEHEDFGLIPLIILEAKTAISINYYGYNYVQSQESITRNTDYKKTIKKFEDALKHYDNMVQVINNKQLQKHTNILYKCNNIKIKRFRRKRAESIYKTNTKTKNAKKYKSKKYKANSKKDNTKN